MLEWFDKLQGPSKRMCPLEDAAYSVALEQFAAVHRIMFEAILS